MVSDWFLSVQLVLFSVLFCYVYLYSLFCSVGFISVYSSVFAVGLKAFVFVHHHLCRVLPTVKVMH